MSLLWDKNWLGFELQSSDFFFLHYFWLFIEGLVNKLIRIFRDQNHVNCENLVRLTWCNLYTIQVASCYTILIEINREKKISIRQKVHVLRGPLNRYDCFRGYIGVCLSVCQEIKLFWPLYCRKMASNWRLVYSDVFIELYFCLQMQK